MTTYKTGTRIAFGLVGMLLVPTLAFAAATTTPAGASKAAAKMTAAKARADQEIDRRVATLNEVTDRVGVMQEVQADFKQNLAGAVSGQVAAFAALKAKIDAETDPTLLKSEVQSINESYRVYALLVPQARIATAADRVVTLTRMMTILGSKLQARIAAAQTAGTDISALSKTLGDLSQKLSDANAQAQSAVSVSVSLVPDEGDKVKMAANAAALKTAHTAVGVAQKDLKDSRKDIATILKGLNVSLSAASSTPTITPGSATASTTTAH
ncbi:MAG: hypothetical protein WCI89_02805 [bacterium]